MQNSAKDLTPIQEILRDDVYMAEVLSIESRQVRLQFN